MTKKRIKSELASIENVKRLFLDTPEKDVITLEDAFKSWGRKNPEKIEAHKPWLSNMLLPLKYHDLLVPVYSFDTGKKKIVALRLTFKGKRALERIESDYGVENTIKSVKNISLDDVVKAIPKLRKENPEFNIIFSVTPKEEQ